MRIIICPGIHPPQLTQEFLVGLQRCEAGNLPSSWTQRVLIFPTQDYPAYSAIHILDYLRRHGDGMNLPVIFISFSAGVAGAIGAAWGWQMLGGTVKAFIALDGWGVPLYGNFPIHRLSHDYFTHWSSALLGKGEESFYADPAVEHLELWEKPDRCQGWWVSGAGLTPKLSFCPPDSPKLEGVNPVSPTPLIPPYQGGRLPQSCLVEGSGKQRHYITAAQFMTQLLEHYIRG